LYTPRQWADLYDANLRLGDWAVGETVRLLRERDLLDDTLLIITADHGEAFGEHGYFAHVNAVYDEFVHIPLLIRLPGQLARTVTAMTETVDLLPTVCDVLDIPYRHRVQGQSLRPLLTGRARTVRDYAFAVSLWSAWPAYLVRDERWSLLLYRGGKLKALYDLTKDPGQQRNVIAQHPDVAARLTAALRAFARSQGRSLEEYITPRAQATPAPPMNPHGLSEKAQRDLKALGYLE
jgi:arylsulfatase A-like enzyme